jgi:uroporphyrinogen-III decarboxylase
MGKDKSSKRLLKDLFEMKPLPRPPFLPMVYRYASKISGVRLEEMLRNPLSLSRGLIMTQELFGYDAIMSNYDCYLEREFLASSLGPAAKSIPCGPPAEGKVSSGTGLSVNGQSITGNVEAVLAATTQLCEIVGTRVPVIGVINGPVSIARRILRERCDGFAEEKAEPSQEVARNIGSALVEMAKSYCDSRVDVIWFVEEDWSPLTHDDIEQIRPLYDTFWNVIRFYDIKTVVAFHDYNEDLLDDYFTMGSDAVLFAGPQAAALSIRSLSKKMEDSGVCVGLACPYPNEHKGRMEELLGFVKDVGYGFFLSTPYEVDIETPVDLMHEMVAVIKEAEGLKKAP